MEDKIEFLSLEEKTLLIEVESIVGQMFFNYRGDQMSYPLTYETSAKGEKTTAKSMTLNVQNNSEEILSARYVVGANHIRIFKALYNVVHCLKEKHGFSIAGFQRHLRS